MKPRFDGALVSVLVSAIAANPGFAIHLIASSTLKPSLPTSTFFAAEALELPSTMGLQEILSDEAKIVIVNDIRNPVIFGPDQAVIPAHGRPWKIHVQRRNVQDDLGRFSEVTLVKTTPNEFMTVQMGIIRPPHETAAHIAQLIAAKFHGVGQVHYAILTQLIQSLSLSRLLNGAA